MAALAHGGSEGDPVTRRVAVVGGGISGLFCASTLSHYGYDVSLFDQGKTAPGGRMTTRRTAWKGLQFDHGCQFIRAESAEFRAVMDDWVAAGVAAEWAGQVGQLSAVTGKFTPRPAPQADSSGGRGDASSSGGGANEGEQPSSSARSPNQDNGFLGVLAPGKLYVGAPSMDAICLHLAQHGGIATVRTDVQVNKALFEPEGKWLLEGRIRQPLRTAQERRQEPPFMPWNLGVYDALVLAGSLTSVALSGSSAAAKLQESARDAGSTTCLALMLGFERAKEATPLLPFAAAALQGSDKISWVCLDSSKPGRARDDGAQCVVALATRAFSESLSPRLPGGGLPPQTPELLARLAPALHEALTTDLAAAGIKLPEPSFVQAHRWGSAFPARDLGFSCLRADSARLAACGDYCAGGGVEGAVLSARAAADVVRSYFE